MRRTSIAVVTSVLCLGVAFQPATAAPRTAAGFDLAPFQVQVTDVVIPGSAGVALDGLLYAPAAAAVHPLVVMPASWGTPKIEYEAVARSLAGKGYVVVAYTTRGFFNSTGEIMVAGAEDQADLSAVITWAQARTPATPGKVGVLGVSYGAGIGLLAAQTDPRVKAVAAMSGWSDLQTSLLPGNTVAAGSIGRLSSIADSTGKKSQLLIDALSAADTGNVDSVIPLAQTRSPGRHVDQINANGAAILIANSWQDGIFPADQFFDSWDRLTVPKRLMLAPGDHALGEAGGLGGLPNDSVDAAKSWMDRYLLGVRNGIDTLSPVRVKPTLGGAWMSYPTLAALRSGTSRQYLTKPSAAFSSGTSLAATKPAAWSATYTGGTESSATSGAPLVTGGGYALGLPPTAWIALVDRSAGLVWQTEPLKSATKLGGLSTVHATVKAPTTRATLVAYLYDVDEFGKGTLLSWQPWTSRNLTAGSKTAFDIRLQPVVATVKAGHRLAVAIDSFDERFRSETTAGQQIVISGSVTDPAYVDFALG